MEQSSCASVAKSEPKQGGQRVRNSVAHCSMSTICQGKSYCEEEFDPIYKCIYSTVLACTAAQGFVYDTEQICIHHDGNTDNKMTWAQCWEHCRCSGGGKPISIKDKAKQDVVITYLESKANKGLYTLFAILNSDIVQWLPVKLSPPIIGSWSRKK